MSQEHLGARGEPLEQIASPRLRTTVLLHVSVVEVTRMDFETAWRSKSVAEAEAAHSWGDAQELALTPALAPAQVQRD